MCGWIKLHRKFLKWEWFDDVSTSHLFLYLTLKANNNDAVYRGIDIKRGQTLTSLNTISLESGLSISSIRTSLRKLESTGCLTNKSTNKYRLITIVNYDSYQGGDKQVTSRSQASDKQVTTNKKEKKERNKEGDSFESTLIKNKNGSRLNEDWELSENEAWGDWAIDELGFSVDETIQISEEFKDYWISKAGKEAVKLNWEATWRNWCRKQISYGIIEKMRKK